MKSNRETVLYVHPVSHDFKVGDEVIDVTAGKNGWPDKYGVIIEIDGTNIEVQYRSGNKRWKKYINLINNLINT